MGKIAAFVVLMATPALAQELYIPSPSELNIPKCLADGSNCLGTVEPPKLPRPSCGAGWTLVYIGTTNGGIVIPKCAAVGDLRDPE